MPTPDNSYEVATGPMTPIHLNDDWSLISKMAMASVSSQGTMGVLLLTGFVSSSLINSYVVNI